MKKSSAMFLLIGKKLVEMQEKSSYDPEAARTWKYTQNWIAYEIGLACQRSIDVWVLCEDVSINFPVPYFNHYQPFATDIDWLRSILETYARAGYLASPSELLIVCPNRDCGVEYFFWGHNHTRPFDVACPQCLQTMRFG
jgi:hypothetical protein